MELTALNNPFCAKGTLPRGVRIMGAPRRSATRPSTACRVVAPEAGATPINTEHATRIDRRRAAQRTGFWVRGGPPVAAMHSSGRVKGTPARLVDPEPHRHPWVRSCIFDPSIPPAMGGVAHT